MKLRPYQSRAIDMTYDWFRSHDSGNPCLVLPTGAGKSLVIAALVRDALQNWPQTRVIMLTHVKELIEQNAAKMRQAWPNAPMGIYSASIGEKVLHEPVTFAGIQSIWKRASLCGHVDLVIIDECHLVSHKQHGQYRQFIDALQAINPALRVIGLTATPYRLGHGMIHQGKDTLFDDIIEPVTVAELVADGYLAPLRSKHTDMTIDTSGVQKRGGEFVAGQLEACVDQEDTTRAIVAETLERAAHCRSWLFFCTGVTHAEHMRDELRANGVLAECVTGKTPKRERELIIAAYQRGDIRALTNANVLTTGFDAPDTDCLVMARPTESPGLYVQMAGRGMRLKQHTDHCLVLDFAGNVGAHGPITAVQPPRQKGSGQAPTKQCPQCDEIVALHIMECPACAYLWPVQEKPPEPVKLHNDDIMGAEEHELTVTGWQWRVHTSKRSGKRMFMVTYYGGLTDAVSEYLTVTHDGFAGRKAMVAVNHLASEAGVTLADTLEETAERFNKARHPDRVVYARNGRFHDVRARIYENDAQAVQGVTGSDGRDQSHGDADAALSRMRALLGR